MSKPQFTRPDGTGGKSVLGSDNVNPLNNLEKMAMNGLDEDKINVISHEGFTNFSSNSNFDINEIFERLKYVSEKCNLDKCLELVIVILLLCCVSGNNSEKSVSLRIKLIVFTFSIFSEIA